MSDEEYLRQMLADWRRTKVVFAQGIMLGILVGFVIGLFL